MTSKTHTQSRFDKINFLLRPQKTNPSSTKAVQQLLRLPRTRNTTAQSWGNMGTENQIYLKFHQNILQQDIRIPLKDSQRTQDNVLSLHKM